jgi:hypothetical protein
MTDKLLQIKMREDDLTDLKSVSNEYSQSTSSFARYIILKFIKEVTN